MSVEITHLNNIDNFTGLSTKQRNKLEEMLQTEIAKDPILAVRSKSEPLAPAWARSSSMWSRSHGDFFDRQRTRWRSGICWT